MHVEVEEGTGLASRLGHDEVVERVVMRDDEIFLDVEEVVDRTRPKLPELVRQLPLDLLQKLGHGCPLIDLCDTSVASAIPITVRDLDHLSFLALLFEKILLLQSLYLLALECFTIAVWEERGVDIWVLADFLLPRVTIGTAARLRSVVGAGLPIFFVAFFLKRKRKFGSCLFLHFVFSFFLLCRTFCSCLFPLLFSLSYLQFLNCFTLAFEVLFCNEPNRFLDKLLLESR
mmetsp:Transcript_17765/g.30621  ORF Transcript_17765/g.30621 Transcript_17765/m.30621 type:complete len:231 (-) Transcript_17765:235-927(-)